MKSIVDTMEQRRAKGKETEVYFHNQRVENKKLERFKKRRTAQSTTEDCGHEKGNEEEEEEEDEDEEPTNNENDGVEVPGKLPIPPPPELAAGN
jgi:hypothetical protein